MTDVINEEAADTYANIMEEVHQRLLVIERALRSQPADLTDQISVSDLCCLQFRKVFEAIALGCLVAHDAPQTNHLKKKVYRADLLLKGLEKLTPDFYPKPCRVIHDHAKGQARIQEAAEGTWLTKELLISAYFDFDRQMHVGTLSRRSKNAQIFSSDWLLNILGRTRLLLWTHYIQLRDPVGRLVVEFGAGGEPVVSIHTRTPNAHP